MSYNFFESFDEEDEEIERKPKKEPQKEECPYCGEEFSYLAGHIDNCPIKKKRDKQKMREKEIQKWIVENCNDYNPEIVAMGIWYYCTRVAEQEYILAKSISGISYGITLFNEHKNIIRAKNKVINKEMSKS